MCGIAGALFWGDENGRHDPQQIVRAMTDALAHRGPDGHGVVRCDDGGVSNDRPTVVLGHRRLAIIDLSPRGAQPMADRSRVLWTSFNGEIYNYRALRRELEDRGRTFTSDSDTEVILHAYEVWGVGAWERLRGMFAFALWDGRRQELMLVRDRLGIKPLYLTRRDGYVLFASEVRALLATGLVPRRLDATGLWQYLSYQTVPAPRTLVEGVRLIEPGCCLTIDGSGLTRETRYWNLLTSASRAAADATPATAASEVRRLLDESIHLHLVSDVPIGVFLSGGIDSSAIVALMRAAGVTPRTFSVGFSEPTYDESQYARRVADRFGADHTHVGLTEGELLDEVPAALAAMDHPSGDGVNSYVVSRAVRQAGLTVALSGLGGDEIFGGYPSFRRLGRAGRSLERWGRAPQVVRGAAAGLVRAASSSVASMKVAAVLESDGSIAATWPITRQLFSASQRRRLLEPRWLTGLHDADPYVDRLAAVYAEAPGAGRWAQVSYAEATTYMHDVLLRDTDQMSMAHGLEVRVPLLDHRLAEYVIGLPDACKQFDGGPKPLLVRALGGTLPDDIVHRPKRGFTLPFDPWMRAGLKEFCAARLGAGGLEARGLFRTDALRTLWTDFLSGSRKTTWSRVWTLVALEAWLDRHGMREPA